MRTKTFIGILSCIAFVLCLYVTPSVNAASSEEEVIQVASNFIKAFNDCDFGLMSSIWWHSPKASEIPPTTGYPFVNQGWSGIEKWWKETFKYPIGTIILTLHNPQAIMLDNNIAVVTGYENVIVNPPAVKEQSISQVRQTLVVQKIDGKWLIVHHHSSGFPI